MNYIIQYVEELDADFEIPELDAAPYRTIQEFMEGEHVAVHAAFLSALYNGITRNLPLVPAFAVKDSDSVVNIARDEYPRRLQECLKYFTDIEQYELCSVLIDLEKQL